MKIKTVKIKNFRSYKDEVSVEFEDLNVFVGKNDVGKSTVLEALDIFFNESKAISKIEKEDINKQCFLEGDTNIVISVAFDDVPTKIVIDSSNETSLDSEYLLNSDGKLEIVKTFPNAGKEKVAILANHPANPNCSDLMLKKQKELQSIIKKESIQCLDEKKNAEMRKAIWNHYSTDLNLQETEIEVSKEDAKNIWDQIKKYMPMFTLFQSDRKNSDGDSEIQDPMKLAVQEMLKDSAIQTTLDEVAEKVESKLEEVANRTLEKLKEMNPEIANTLKPVFPSVENLKWAEVFKSVSISGDDDILINKRGSGVKRLVLLNFFRAEAERRREEKNVPDIIYAIEEPETSQHPNYQRKLIEAFIELTKTPNTQIILTTHSPSIVKMLDFCHLKLIKDEDGRKKIVSVEKNNLPYPSLNEVNFMAFGESDEEYHNELYGYIESECKLNKYKQGKSTRSYERKNEDGSTKTEQKILSEYIRHLIHHPENKCNPPFTSEELQKSISEMREFIKEMDCENN